MPEKKATTTPEPEPTAVSLHDCAIEAVHELERAQALISIVQSAIQARAEDDIRNPYYEVGLCVELVQGCFERATSRVSELLWHERVQAEGARR